MNKSQKIRYIIFSIVIVAIGAVIALFLTTKLHVDVNILTNIGHNLLYIFVIVGGFMALIPAGFVLAWKFNILGGN